MAWTLVREWRRRPLPSCLRVFAGMSDCCLCELTSAEAREVFDLENFDLNVKLGVDPYEGCSFDEWLAANPVPEKWRKRLERDEADIVMKWR